MARKRRLLKLLGSSAADQVLSALSNFAITLAVVRGGGPDALGRYAIAFAVYLVVLPLTRALVSEPMLASPRVGSDERTLRSSATAVLSVAVLSAVPIVSLGLLLGRRELVALGVVLPLTLAQDVLRYQAFWTRRPNVAVVLDGGWLLGAVVAWPIISAHPSAGVAVICWAGAAGLGILSATPVLRLRVTSLRETARWWREEAHHLAAPMAIESIVFALSAQAMIFVVATVLSVGDLGVLRAGQVYFMPVALTLGGCASVAIPYLAQRPVLIKGAVVTTLSGGMLFLAVLGATAIVFAEPVLHTVLYAQAVEVPRALLLPIAAQVVCSAFASALVIVAKAQRRGRDLLFARISSTAFGLSSLVPATMVWRLEGAAWVLAVQAAFYAAHLIVRSHAALDHASTSALRMSIGGSVPEGDLSTMVRVSVVIPVHNGAEYVGDAIRSVLEQTYTNFEVIVVDDGSSDSTVDVVMGFADQRVQLISQRQGGVAVARNRGLSEATGERVAFLDHDDLWFPDKLASQLPAFADDEVGFVGSFMTYLTDRGPAPAAAGEDTAGQQDRLATGRLMPFPLSSLIVRTELLRRVGGFDERLAHVAQVEDLDLIARLSNRAQVHTITRPLGYYRLHPGAASFRTFGAMRRGTRFVRARIAAAEVGRELSWENWARDTADTWRMRRTDRANFLYRSAGFHIVSGNKVRGYRDLFSAVALSPGYVFTRLVRQRSAAKVGG